MTPVRVTTAAQASARDRAAVAAGTPSMTLMEAAGAAAVAVLRARCAGALSRGTRVLAGAGNNGGDGWVVARRLHQARLPVAVQEVEAPRTPDARAAREAAVAAGVPVLGANAPVPESPPGVVVDALLGTGAAGPPRAPYDGALRRLAAMRDAGALVVAMDLPSALDPDTGADHGAVPAHLTVTFGTVKRGLLLNRDAAGAVVAVDIGLGAHADLDDGAPALADAARVARTVPLLRAAEHKGSRRRVTLVGGAPGMAGAVVLAARGALHSGAGLVRAVVAPASLPVVQGAVPAALAAPWPDDDAALAVLAEWCHAVAIGPGLGRDDAARAQLHRWMRGTRVPLLLDADAVTLWAGQGEALRDALAGRPALLTPHVVEGARLLRTDHDELRRDPVAGARALAAATGAVVLLKGVPTVVADPAGRAVVVAAGSPVLATGGSGDILAGIAAVLLAQVDDVLEAAVAAAWVHGRAAELVAAAGPVRGATLDDVLAALRPAWALDAHVPAPPVLAVLPDVSARR